MYPSFGVILGIDVRPYHVIRWTYFIIAPLMTAYLNRRRGISPVRSLAPFAIGIPAAMIGGHLLNIFESWPTYRRQPEQILDVLAGGNSIFGALAFGIGAGVLYLRWQRLPVRAFLDAAAPAMALGEAMTRVGCFLSGCCFGVPTQSLFGVAFPRGSYAFTTQVTAGLISPSNLVSLPVHPTQLYSAVLSTLLFGVLLWIFLGVRTFPGATFCLFLFGYGLQRLAVGWWRADAVLYWWEVSPVLSVLTVVVACGLWLLWRPEHRAVSTADCNTLPAERHRPGLPPARTVSHS